jgi:uncharacterized protein YjbI with pentapeptide repeats
VTELDLTRPPRPDLRGAHLTRRDLAGVRLAGADLRGADLRASDLRGAHLEGAALALADLRGADLSGADLSGADLEQADLRSADLTGARLWDAKLRGARLDGANLGRAELRGADLRAHRPEWTARLEASPQGEENFEPAGAAMSARLDGADLTGADLRHAYLDDVEGLGLEQLRAALVDQTTMLPAELRGAVPKPRIVRGTERVSPRLLEDAVLAPGY